MNNIIKRNNKIFLKSIKNKTELDIRKDLHKIIDNIYRGIMPVGNQIILKETPKNLQKLGVMNSPFLMSPREIRNALLSKEKAIDLNYPIGKNENYHNLGKKIFLKVLEDLKSPVIVIKENKGKIVVITEQFDYKHNQIIIPIEINTNSDFNSIEINNVNVIKSIHGRTSIKNYLNNLLSKNAKIIYVDNKKIQSLLDDCKVQYPETICSVRNNNSTIKSIKNQGKDQEYEVK